MILIGNGRLITNDESNPYLDNGCIAVEGNLIREVGETATLRQQYPDAEYIDVGSKVIMPGFINVHHHIYSAFARGFSMENPPARCFTDILENVWWRIDKKLSLEDIRYSSYTTLIESIRSGVTTVFDHHASPMAVRDSLFTIREVAERLGIRGCYCYETSDRDGQQILQEGIDENIAFMDQVNKSTEGLSRGMFGMHASFTLSDESLQQCVAAMADRNPGYHIHVAEGQEDVNDCEKKYGKRVVERLADFGILKENSLAVHCVHVNEQEQEILKNLRTNVVNNPQSNMGNAVGCAPVIEMMAKGINLGLGTDGYTSDMTDSLKTIGIIQKHRRQDSNVGFNESIDSLWTGNPRICSHYYDRPLGVIKEGAYADIITLDYRPTTPMNQENWKGHMIFGFYGRETVDSMINGAFVLRNREIVSVDEQKILAEARAQAGKFWQKF